MSQHKRIIAAVITCSLLAGCSRGIKEGIYSITGSSGKVVLLQGDKAAVGRLARNYGNVDVLPFTNDVGPICPGEFLNALPSAITDELRYRSASFGERIKGKDKEELGPFLTGPADKTMLISGRVIQYETGEFSDKALSPMEEAICRVRIQDADTDALLVEANCTGRVKSSLRTGPTEMAQGVAKAIRKMLKPTDN